MNHLRNLQPVTGNYISFTSKLCARIPRLSRRAQGKVKKRTNLKKINTNECFVHAVTINKVPF